MQISQLPASSSFSGSDVIAIEIDGVTYKLTGSTLATALRTIGGALPVANGGTGASNANGALKAISSNTLTGIRSGYIEQNATATISNVNNALLFVWRTSLCIYSISDGNAARNYIDVPSSLTVSISNKTLTIRNTSFTCKWLLVEMV